MLPLVLAAVFGPTAYELYYLGYATSKNCLQIEIITGKHYATTDRWESKLGHLCTVAFSSSASAPYYGIS